MSNRGSYERTAEVRAKLTDKLAGVSKPDGFGEHLSKVNSGKVYVNNGTKNKCVTLAESAAYLASGWNSGRIITGGNIWITNGVESTKVTEAELESWISKGWRKGKVNKRKV